MTLPSQNSYVYRLGNGATTSFTFDFQVLVPEEVRVTRLLPNNLIEEINPADYTVTLAPGGIGGSIFIEFDGDPLPSGDGLYIYRKTMLSQEVSVSSQTSYNPIVVVAVWDKLTAIAQELQAGIDLALKAVPGQDPSQVVNDVFNARAQAVQAAANALISETNASDSEDAASVSAGEALTQRNAANSARVLAEAAQGAAEMAAIASDDSADLAASSAVAAGTSAGTATTQAGIATTQAGIATTKAGEAAGSATTASTQAGTATTQAGTATTKAGEAAASATLAQNWAESPTAPGGAGTKSAKTHAEEAALSAASIDADKLVPIGMTSFWTGGRAHIPDGWDALDGQVVNRADFPDLWAAVNAGVFPTVADATWLSSPGKRGCFTPGDGTTTFRFPDANGKFAGSLQGPFFRGDGKTGTAIGDVLGDAIRNIVGEAYHQGAMGMVRKADGGTATGAFKKGSTDFSNGFGVVATLSNSLMFDASLVVPTADENRPVSFVAVAIMRTRGVYNAVIAPGTGATLGANVFSGSQKINGDLEVTGSIIGGVEPPYYEEITASGTWTKPAGYSPDAMVIIEGWGAGGGGRHNTVANQACGGGGGGAYKKLTFRYADFPSTLAIVIGAGGAAGVNSSGGDGGDTTAGSIFTAYGGAGGAQAGGVGGGGVTRGSGTTTPGWPGGGASGNPATDYWGGGGGGNTGVSGSDGGAALFGGAGGGGAGGSGSTVFAGGISHFGGGGGGQGGPTSTAGIAPGGGGGGSKSAASPGARGEIRIWIYG